MVSITDNRLLETILSGVDDGVLIANTDGRITMLNRPMRELFAIDRDQPPDGEWIRGVDFVPPGSSEPLTGEDHPVRRTISGESMVNRPLTLVPLAGAPRMVNLSSSPLVDEDGTILGAILRISDLSVRKTSQIKGAQSAGADGEASAADLELESFIYSVSHDLQAPLRHIIGFSALLNEEFPGGEESTGRGYINRIRQSCDRIQALINDLLLLSRKTRGRMFVSTVNLSEIASSMLAEMGRQAPDRKVELRIEPDIEVKGDQRLLIELMHHLLENAWKFTGKRERAVIQFGRETKGDESVYYVRDNGVGFDLHQADKLFLPFRRLHGRDFPGNGIGLATCLRVINRHGGRIWADAKPNHGATFWFTLGL